MEIHEVPSLREPIFFGGILNGEVWHDPIPDGVTAFVFPFLLAVFRPFASAHLPTLE